MTDGSVARCSCSTWAWAPEMGHWEWGEEHHPRCPEGHREGCDCLYCALQRRKPMMGMDYLPDDAYERTMEAKAPPCRNCIELLHGEVYFADRVVQDLKLLQQHMEHFGFSQLLVGTINRMLDYSQYHLDVHKELSEKAKAQRAKNDGERAEDLGAGRLGEDGEVHGGNGL